MSQVLGILPLNSSGIIQKIKNVLYAPGIVKNLLSVGFLASKGLSLVFKEKGCTINDSAGGLITTTVWEPENGLYRLVGETIKNCSD